MSTALPSDGTDTRIYFASINEDDEHFSSHQDLAQLCDLLQDVRSERRKTMAEAKEPSLQVLNALVGEWGIEASHPMVSSTVVHGHSVFEWLEGEKFLIVRARLDHLDFPDSISIIGDTEGLRMHYFDSRGVARIYQMSIMDGVWKLWRDTADFSPLDFAQRFVGTFSNDDKTIDGRWEICRDDATWEDDLQITYRRTTGPSSS